MMIVFYILGIIFLFNAVLALGLIVKGKVVNNSNPSLTVILLVIILFICGLGLLWIQ